MSEFRVGLNDVRKKILEEIRVGAQAAQQMYSQPMAHINPTEIGNRLSSGHIRPESSSAASSL